MSRTHERARRGDLEKAVETLHNLAGRRAALDREELAAIEVMRSEGYAWRIIASLTGANAEVMRRKYGYIPRYLPMDSR